MPFFARLAIAAALLGTPAALAEDAIVGSWAGEVAQGDHKFEALVTFVSPKGGISRYPGYPCGGILSGGPVGDEYRYSETITYGGLDEIANGCIPGEMYLSIDGGTMKYVWKGTYNGENLSAEGELKRVKRR